MSKFTTFIIIIFTVTFIYQPIYSNESENQSGTDQTEKEKPEKPKSYTERYKDFYKDYSNNYKERHKGENYRKHYQDLHRENMESFNNAGQHLHELREGENKLWNDAKRLDPQSADMFRRDKYGKKIPTRTEYKGGPVFRNSYKYRDMQYRKRGYNIPYYLFGVGRGVIYNDPDLWIPNPAADNIIVNGEWQDDPLSQNFFSRGRRKNTLPQSERITLPEHIPSAIQKPYQLPRRYNPFMMQPGMVPPHLTASASQEYQSTPPDKKEEPLPHAKETDEKPDTLDPPAPNSSQPQQTNAIKDPMTIPHQTQSRTPVNRQAAPGIQSPLQLLYNNGLQSFNQRKYRNARQQFEKLVSANPGSPHTHFGYGLSLFFTGEYNPSYKAFQDSINLTSRKRVLPPNLWQMQTNPDDFRSHFKKLANHVEQNPNDRTARELLFYLSRISSKPPNAQQQ